MLPTPLHCTSICGGSGTGSGSEPEPVPEPEYMGGLSELNIYNKCWNKCWQLWPKCWQMLDQLLATVGPTVGNCWTNCWQLLAQMLTTVGPTVANCWPKCDPQFHIVPTVTVESNNMQHPQLQLTHSTNWDSLRYLCNPV